MGSTTIIFLISFFAFFIEVAEPTGRFVRNGMIESIGGPVLVTNLGSCLDCDLTQQPSAKKSPQTKKSTQIRLEKSHWATPDILFYFSILEVEKTFYFHLSKFPQDGFEFPIDRPPIPFRLHYFI